MEAKLKQKLNTYAKDSYYIVGVSGGCDSMCLLDLLYKNNFKIVVCHVNYQLRHDTQIDYDIVFNYCQQRDIPFYYKEVTQQPKENFQQFARHFRYDFYFEIGKIYHTNKVFLGHHKDDVYETILMQKKRHGAQLYWGIKEECEVRKNNVHRILLNVTKKEIIAYCNKYHIPYHDDYTNFETHYQRDYIRNIILPKMNEDEKKQLLNDANQHNLNLMLKQQKSELLLKQCLRNDRFYFLEIEREDLPEVVHRYLEQKVPIKRISEALIKEMVQAIVSKQPNMQITLPVNLRFIKEYDNGYIQTLSKEVDYEYHFLCLDEFECPYFKLAKQGSLHTGIGLLESDFPITIRNFRNGDVVATKFGHKKVSRLFIDNKIPQKLRKSWPILLNKDNEILLIPHIVKNLRYLDTKPNVFVVK